MMTAHTKKLKIAILVSGNGSNLQILIDAMQAEALPIEIVGVISNREDSYAIERAKQASLNMAVLSHVNEQGESAIADGESNNAKPSNIKRMGMQTFETLALEQLNKWQPDLIVLAGFMRILSADFISGCPAPIINLHPSLLPKYKGLDTHAKAIAADEQYHGCSIHMVTAELDAGQVIAQAVLSINSDDTASSLQLRVHQLEHKMLPWVIKLIANGIFTDKKINSELINLSNFNKSTFYPDLPWQLSFIE